MASSRWICTSAVAKAKTLEMNLQHQFAAGAEALASNAVRMSLNGNWEPGVELQLSPRWFQLDQQANVVRTLAEICTADVVIRNSNASD